MLHDKAKELPSREYAQISAFTQLHCMPGLGPMDAVM
jgi:hypothetical protein